MRKLKLLFACLLMAVLGIGQMWATDPTVTNTDNSGTCVWTDGTATITQVKWAGSTNVNNTYATNLRVYGGHVLLFDAGEGNEWTSFEYTVATTYYGKSVVWGSSASEITSSNYSSATAGTGSLVSTSGGSSTLSFTSNRYAYVYNSATSSPTQLRITSFTATYTTAGGGGSTASVSVNPTSWDFGTVAESDVADKEFLVSGSNLTAGTLTLSAPAGFTVSPNLIPVSEATLASTPVTVSKNTATAGTYDANLTISGCGLEDAVTVALSMEVKAEYTVTWNNNGTTSTTQVLDGDKPVFPATPASCDATSTTFYGWATSAWTGKTDDISGYTIYTKAADMPAVAGNGVVYYAVFCEGGSSTGGISQEEITSAAEGKSTGSYANQSASSASGNWTGRYAWNTQNSKKVMQINGTSGNSIISPVFDGDISNIAITYTNSSNSNRSFYIKNGENSLGTITAGGNNTEYTEDIDVTGSYTSFTITASGALYIHSISVTYGGGGTNYMTTCCTKYNVNIAAGITNGSVSADPASACEGTTVTLTFTPSLNYHLSGWTLNGTAQDVNDNTFTMPAEAVTVSATFAEDACTPLNTPSVTVSGKAYPYDAVQLSWAAVSFADAYKVYIYDAEDNELEKDEAFTGVVYTIGQTLSGSTTYKYSVQAVSNTPTAYCPSTAATGTFVTDALPTAHLTLVDIDGTHASSGDYAILTPFNLPATAAACAKTFVGWDADADCATDPTYAKGAEFTFANTTCVTLYAVYADVTGGGTATTNIAYSGATTNMTGDNDVASFGLDAADWSVVGAKGNSSNYPGLNTAGDIRLYYAASGGNTLTITAPQTITSVGLTFTSAGYSNAYVMAGGETVALSDGVYPINATSFVIGNANTSNTQVRISNIAVNFTTSGTPSNYSTTCAEKTATPTFTLAAGTYTTAQTVGITCATDGATIYYTTDGTDPTTSSTEYTAAISLSERGETTIKAIAVKAGAENSDIATAAYNINLPFASVTELFTYLDANSLTSLNDVTVTGVVSQIVTAYDGSKVTINISDDGQTTGGQLQGYRTVGDAAATVAVGDRVTLTGNYTLYNSTTRELSQGNSIVAHTAKVLSSVTVSGTAVKTVYSAGESFDFDGLVATANYSNTGYSAAVDNAEVTWATDLAEDKVVENTTAHVTATYSGMTSAAYDVAVTVSAKTLVSIAVGTASYTIYSSQALPHPTVTATYSEGEPEDVSASAVYDTENVFDTDTPDEYTITVSYTFGGATQTATYTVTVQDYANDADHPYTVAQAIDLITNVIGITASARDIYVQGIVSKKNNPGSGAQTYYISDDGTTTVQMEVYKGKYFNGANFTNANQMLVGDQVMVSGKVKMYESTPEFDAGSWVRSQTRVPGLAISDVASLEVGQPDLTVADLDVTVDGDGEITLVSGDDATATIVNNAIHAVAPGTVTITANLAADGIYSANSTTFTVTVIAAQTRYAVTFNANGGTGDAPVVADKAEGDVFALPDNTYTYAGQKFAGWSDGMNTYAAGASYTMPAAAVTFTAQWEAICTWATVYTSNVVFTGSGDSYEANSKVNIDDVDYKAQKVGASSKTGSVVVTVPAGAHTLHFHAAAWNGKNVTIEASGVTNMSQSSFSLTGDAGVKNSGTYILESDPVDQHFHFTFDAVAEATEITFSKTSGTDNRFVMYGINQEGGPELKSLTIGGTATTTAYEIGQSFNTAGLTVSAVYAIGGVDQDPVEVTSQVVWSVDPTEFSLTSQTSVTVTASLETMTATKTVDVTVSETSVPGVSHVAIVVKKGDTYYAMGQTLSGGALNAVPLEGVINGKMINVPVENRAAITWKVTITADGATYQAQDGKYLAGNSGNTTLSWSDVSFYWTWSETYGCYAVDNYRSFYMYGNNSSEFKNYALSNFNSNASICSTHTMELSEYIDMDLTGKEFVVLREGLVSGKLGTICWNADIYEVEGAVFYDPEVKLADGVRFVESEKEGGVFPMGKPYLFQASGEVIRALVGTTTTADAGTNNGMFGTFVDLLAAPSPDTLILYDNKLRAASNNWVRANRAYFLRSQLPEQSSAAPSRRRLVVGRDEEPTAVENIEADQQKAKKVMIDGQMYIVREGRLYDATGRQVR